MNEAVKLDPNNEIYFRTRGHVHKQKKEYQKAIDDYSEVIKLKPDDAFAYSQRGYAYMEKKEYVKAIADFDDAIRLERRPGPPAEWSLGYSAPRQRYGP